MNSFTPIASESDTLAADFHATRSLTADLADALSDADATIQSMEDASPAKWHLAHTTWFWETFCLRDHAPDYRMFDDQWPFLFNSYYEAEGERIGRSARGLLSRPTLAEIVAYRSHVTKAMHALLDRADLAEIIALGIAHEQQHQELLLTDIKHALYQNPLGPAMFVKGPHANATTDPALHNEWDDHPGGIAQIGHDGDGFAFDNEGPRHRVFLEPFALRTSLVTNAEWLAFRSDGGYEKPGLWLSDGWQWRCQEGIDTPLYWRDDGQGWEQFTHAGWQPLDRDAPVTHISYFEADAFATWAGHRLPTEFEWEAIAARHDPRGGNQLDTAAAPMPEGACANLFGDCWQFTRSAYLPYPGFYPAAGAIGEYNGKFMSGQCVLKGASCATARGHSRPTYRNFFYPHQRWQFTGLRLAKDR